MTDSVSHDRQILVVGEGLAAATSGGFLEQAGLDPVLAVPDSETPSVDSPLVTIWKPGLDLLERVGLRRPIERLGTPLTQLESVTHGESVDGGLLDQSALVAIRRDALHDLLANQLFSRIQKDERPVTRIRSTKAGVQASFRAGVEERFDAVVTSTLSPVAPREQISSGSSVHVWEFEWPSTVPSPRNPIEAWDGEQAALVTPLDDGAIVRLVAGSVPSRSAALDLEDLETRFGALFDRFEDPLPALDPYELRYRQPSRSLPASLFGDGFILVGAAAHASMPGDCLGAALGIEDAWVAADTLAYGPPEVDEALPVYESRRQRRQRELESAIGEGAADSRLISELTPPLRRLYLARTLAFGPVLDDQLPEFVRGVPERL